MTSRDYDSILGAGSTIRVDAYSAKNCEKKHLVRQHSDRNSTLFMTSAIASDSSRHCFQFKTVLILIFLTNLLLDAYMA